MIRFRTTEQVAAAVQALERRIWELEQRLAEVEERDVEKPKVSSRSRG